ncbi:MAG: PEP-CTERM sorting domain-containing protein [Rubrivivax sp.]|jgi:hypothetical protein
MKMGTKMKVLAASVALVAATSANALTTWNFELLGDLRTGLVGTTPTFDPTHYGVIARGSFSSNLNSGVIGLADLTSFKLQGVAADIVGFSMNLVNPFASFSSAGHRHFQFATTTSVLAGSAGAVPGDVYLPNPFSGPDYPRASLAFLSAASGGVFADFRNPGDPAGFGALGFNGYGLAASQTFHWDTSSVTLAAVPEPSAIALAIASLGALGFLSRRRRAVPAAA